MTPTDPTPEIDRRFGDADAEATPWPDAARTLEAAELYWLTTVRDDGRPHVTPLIGVFRDGAMHFCTGVREQKARNLEHRPHVALTTGTNTWDAGLDVVVEGTVGRITDRVALQELADAYVAKYGEVWRFTVGDEGFGEGDDAAAVFRIEPAKILAFAKDPHAQTRYRFSGG